MRRWHRLAFICALLLGMLAAPQQSIQAARPPGPFFQGFEQNTNGWFNGADRNIVRRPSGWVPTSGSDYGPGIPSAAGQWHARLEDSGTSCVMNCDGPFTRWGGYASVFPEPGYKTQVDIYLDVNWAASHQDVRFDWISAINNSDGTFHRDFVFNVGTELPLQTPHFIIQSSTNSTRSGANPNAPCPNPAAPPNNGCRPPLIINTSGWYTFRHTFRDGGDGFLDVDFDIFALGNPTPLIHWTIDGDRPPSDDDPMSTMGGNRYGWFSNEEVPDLAIDNSLRVGLCRAGGGDGDVQDDNSGRHGHAHFNGKKCEDGSESGDIEESDQSSGDNFQSDSVAAVTFTQDESSQTLTMVGTGTHNGLPVAFTMVSIDNGTLAPALFSLVLSDGYAIAGSVTSGAVSIG